MTESIKSVDDNVSSSCESFSSSCETGSGVGVFSLLDCRGVLILRFFAEGRVLGEESSVVVAGDRMAVASAFFRRAAVFRLEGAILDDPFLIDHSKVVVPDVLCD